MIVEVYPILKLPRKCSYFDYDARLEVASGDLVRIPFKGRETLGIVRAVKESSEAKRLVRVNSIAKPNYLTANDLRRYETIAECLAQSVSSVLQSVFPTIFFDGLPPFVQTSKTSHIGALDIPILEHCLSEINLNKTLSISGDRDIGFALAHVLRRKRTGQMLVLLPRERDAELLSQYIKFSGSTCLLNGKTSHKDRARIFEGWRTGQIDTLIGTRAASLLPAHKLHTLLVLEAGNDEFVNERRNPRFDAREAAKLLAHDHDAHIVFFDSLPRLEELNIAPLVTTLADINPTVVINQGSADEITNEPLLSDSVISGIETALQSQKKVLLYLNRKGVAKRLQCGKCGHIPLCGTCGHVPAVRHDDLACPNCQTEMWIPAQCPACGHTKLGLRGLGGTKILSNLQKLFPGASLGKIDKDEQINPEADILIVTEYFFSSQLEPFAPKRFGLVADLAVDIGLHAGDFRGAEETARKLFRLLHFANRQGATVLAQTWLPDLIRPMLDLQTFSATELGLRSRYQLPPTTARYILQNTQLENLPSDLQTVASERDSNIELPVSVKRKIKQLPDTIKIQFDGTYVQGHESPPQSE
jgi:primosomal protein N'